MVSLLSKKWVTTAVITHKEFVGYCFWVQNKFSCYKCTLTL